MKQRPRYGNACFPPVPATSTFTPAKPMRGALNAAASAKQAAAE